MRVRRYISRQLLVVVAAAALCGCASMVVPADESRAYSLIEDALTVPVPVLEERAAANDGRAQYALSLIYRHGLQGIQPDGVKANALKQKAMVRRSYHPMPQYMAGLDGKPGRTTIVNMPVYDVSALDSIRAEGCVQVLIEGITTVSAGELCGTAEQYVRIQRHWKLQGK